MKPQQDLPTILQEYQQKNCLNEHQMARLLGVTQSCYNNWKNRKVAIGIKHYPIISKICQIDVMSILSSQTSSQFTLNPVNATSFNPIELYQTFTAPLYEIISMLKREIKEKDSALIELRAEIDIYKSRSIEIIEK